MTVVRAVLRLACVGVLAWTAGACSSIPGTAEEDAAALLASPAPLAPRGAGESVSAEAYNLRAINAYRARAGVEPVELDPSLSAFALEGSRTFRQERRAHGHFRRASRSGALFRVHGFSGPACENQGDPNGWPPMGSVEAQIDDILAAMWREGPGGGHYDNLTNPRVKRVGIGLIVAPDGRLWLTNDFGG
jgi:uncharacterized protein YkwD